MGFPQKILFTPDNKKIIIGKYDEDGINLIDIGSGKIQKVKVEANWGFGFIDMAISRSGEYLAVTTTESLHLLKLPEFKLIKSINIPNVVKGLAFNINSNEILVGVSNGILVKYNISESRLTSGDFMNTARPQRISFAPELDKLVCANSDYSIDLWNISEKRLVKTIYKPEFAFPVVDINNINGRLLIGGTKDMMVRLYSSSNENPILLGPHNSEVQLAKFSPSGKYIITTTSSWYKKNERHGFQEWDVFTGKSKNEIGTGFSQSIVHHISENTIVSKQNDNMLFWNLSSSEIKNIGLMQNCKNVFTINSDSVYSLHLISPNKYVIHDILRNKTILSFDLEINPDMRVEFWISKDRKLAVITGLKYYLPDKAEEIVKIFDLQSGDLKFKFTNNKADVVDDVSFLNSNQRICLISHDLKTKSGKIRLIDLESNKITTHFRIPLWSKTTLLENSSMLNISSKKALELNLTSGSKNEVLFPLDSFKRNSVSDLFRGENFSFMPTKYIPSNKRFLIAQGRFIRIINLANGDIEGVLQNPSRVRDMYLINRDTVLAAITDNGAIKYWNLKTRAELAELFNYSEKDWLVKTPEGLFDGSAGAMESLYFISGLDVIEFSQLKERYYEPGLVRKIISGRKLRNTLGFRSIDLPPDVHVGQVDEKGYLPIELINRGGGIGEVAVYINGKEVTKDARDKNANPNTLKSKIQYYIGKHKNLTEGDNIIGVKAWNKDHWVESRSTAIIYTNEKIENYQSAVHILTCGISDYVGGSEIDLMYAAKDAEDVSKALKLGASRLFGTQKNFIYNLTTSQPKEFWPTKINILKTFEKISSTAHPLDVIVVYLSGHGINIGGSEADWHYLTQEAYTPSASAYSDPDIRKQTTISSNELVELFKNVPAAKQVLIIDACASGKVVDNLITKKDVPSSTLRALDRMKDRTGMHIITGCTADAVSYEASRYGQGVLTYSLLEGIRGAALREDEFVDVNRLFQYAQDRVPVLASGIGGIQIPMVFSPNGSQSFDIGQLTEIERKEIPISKIRSVYIQSNFQDEDEMSDVLGLGKKVDLLLGESSAKGTEAPLIFVPVREYPEGCQLVGRYKKENGMIHLKLKKKCDGKDVTVDITGTDMNDLSNKIFKTITN